jgi:hypothetical protein
MVSAADRLNYLFHYDVATEMDGLDYNSRKDFVTEIHDDSRSRSLENYAERNPEAKVLDAASAAIVYELKFDGQDIEVRLEYDAEEEVIGVDMRDNGKKEKFIRQLYEALDENIGMKGEGLTSQV